MKDRVQYPTEKKKKQQQTFEDKKKDKDVNVEHDDSIINGARINGGLEDVQNLSNGSKNKKGLLVECGKKCLSSNLIYLTTLFYCRREVNREAKRCSFSNE